MFFPKITSVITIGPQKATPAKSDAISSDFNRLLYTRTEETKYDGLNALASQGEVLVKRPTSLNDIVFSKGLALCKDGSKFNGFIEDKLPNGDSVRFFYKEGVLQQSARKGSVNFDKTYYRRWQEYDVVKRNYDKSIKEYTCYDLHDNGKVAFVNFYNDDTIRFDEQGQRCDRDNDFLHGEFRRMFIEEDDEFNWDFKPLFEY